MTGPFIASSSVACGTPKGVLASGAPQQIDRANPQCRPCREYLKEKVHDHILNGDRHDQGVLWSCLARRVRKCASQRRPYRGIIQTRHNYFDVYIVGSTHYSPVGQGDSPDDRIPVAIGFQEIDRSAQWLIKLICHAVVSIPLTVERLHNSDQRQPTSLRVRKG